MYRAGDSDFGYPDPERRRAPWTGDDVVRVLAQNTVGFLVLVIAAYLSSRGEDVDRSLLWFNVSLAGLVVGGAANAVWLLRLRRSVGRHRDLACKRVARRVADRSQATAVADDSALVAAVGQQRFHRSECAFVHDRDLIVVNPESTDLAPCEMCEP